MKEMTVGEYTRVDKRVARGMFDIGKEVIMCASNMRLEYGISTAKLITWESFDNTCNHFSYYNCNKETGHRINFFVKEEERECYTREHYTNYYRKYNKDNKERLALYRRMYYSENKEKCFAYTYSYASRNRDQVNRTRQNYIEKHRHTGNHCNRWTKQEVEILMDSFNNGETYAEIAKKLNRTFKSIDDKIYKERKKENGDGK